MFPYKVPAHSLDLIDVNYPMGTLTRVSELLIWPRCEVDPMMDVSTVKAACLPASQEVIA